MTLEAMPRKGEVRTRDLRAVYGDRLNELGHVDVLVVADAGTPLAARIYLMDRPAGRGVQRALVCPACEQPRYVLLAKDGCLKCSQCHRHRTRRQLERNLASWNRLGGRQGDQVLRLLLRPTRPTPARMEQAIRLARQLVSTDRVRAAQLREELSALMTAAQSRE
jgi:hypothetical protein